MMSYSLIDISTLTAGRGPHPAGSPFDKRVTEALGVRAFELYQVELPAGEQTEPHDHVADDVEDVYAIIRGGGWLVVDGRRVALRPGHFVAVAKGATRYVLAGDTGCDLIAICA